MMEYIDLNKKRVGYKIINYYSNAIENDYSTICYGDIFLNHLDVLRAYPNAKVIEGYGLLNLDTGNAVDESDDWYDSKDEILVFIEAMIK